MTSCDHISSPSNSGISYSDDIQGLFVFAFKVFICLYLCFFHCFC
jgi:hypothetical protein